MRSWNARYKLMKADLKLTNADIAEIIGSSVEMVQVSTSGKRFPRWLKVAIKLHEYRTGCKCHTTIKVKSGING